MNWVAKMKRLGRNEPCSFRLRRDATAALVLTLCLFPRLALADFVTPQDESRLASELREAVAKRKGMWTAQSKEQFVGFVIEVFRRSPEKIGGTEVDRFILDYRAMSPFTYVDEPNPASTWIEMEKELTRARIEGAFLPRLTRRQEESIAIRAQFDIFLTWISKETLLHANFVPADLIESMVAKLAKPLFEERADRSLSYFGLRPLSQDEMNRLLLQYRKRLDAMASTTELASRAWYDEYLRAVDDANSSALGETERAARLTAAEAKFLKYLEFQFAAPILGCVDGLLQPTPSKLEQQLAQQMKREFSEDVNAISADSPDRLHPQGIVALAPALPLSDDIHGGPHSSPHQAAPGGLSVPGLSGTGANPTSGTQPTAATDQPGVKKLLENTGSPSEGSASTWKWLLAAVLMAFAGLLLALLTRAK